MSKEKEKQRHAEHIARRRQHGLKYHELAEEFGTSKTKAFNMAKYSKQCEYEEHE